LTTAPAPTPRVAFFTHPSVRPSVDADRGKIHGRMVKKFTMCRSCLGTVALPADDPALTVAPRLRPPQGGTAERPVQALHHYRKRLTVYHSDGSTRMDETLFRDQPMGVHGLHDWWYGCLGNAGVVAAGQTSAERMHKARHTAGQPVLDATGNLKAVQKLLGHESIQTTGDIYTDWEVEQARRVADRGGAPPVRAEPDASMLSRGAWASRAGGGRSGGRAPA
jgi:integrase-like protein